MSSLLSNWKTSVTGLIIIGLGALGSFVGIQIPGFTMDFGAALIMGVGMLLAKDSNVTGGTKPQ